MADLGFLEQLGLSPEDERALLAQTRMNETDGFRQLGMGARRALGGLVGGVQGLFTGENYTGGEKGGRSFRGFLANVGEGAMAMEDMDAANLAGITPQELMARRQIRKELSQIPDDGTFGTRERIAHRMAEIAAASGSPTLQANALAALDRLKIERAEFEKLQMDNRQAKLDYHSELIEDGFYGPEGKAVTGIKANRENEDGTVDYGLNLELNGEIQFVPWGRMLRRDDPSAEDSGESIDERMRKAFKKDDISKVRNLVNTNALALRKFDRVMSTLTDLRGEGGVESVIGDSGRLIAWTDNLVRNIRGVVRGFSGSRQGMAKDLKADPRRGWSGIDSWRSRANDADDPIWELFELPEWAQGVSAAAQQHRAQIMELAYMAARLAEPSNRGLSDNDIHNALARIAGDTSNPQVIMRRFMEIVDDSAFELENQLKSFYGSVPGISNEEVDRFFGGKLIGEYRVGRQQLYDKFNLTMTPEGRATFADPLDADVPPGQNVGGAAVEDQPQDDTQFLDGMLGDDG